MYDTSRNEYVAAPFFGIRNGDLDVCALFIAVPTPKAEATS
jgi:hypothetical protein